MALTRKQRERVLQRVRMLPPAAQDAFYKWSFDQDVRTANAMLWMLGVMALALIGLSVYVIGIS